MSRKCRESDNNNNTKCLLFIQILKLMLTNNQIVKSFLNARSGIDLSSCCKFCIMPSILKRSKKSKKGCPKVVI